MGTSGERIKRSISLMPISNKRLTIAAFKMLRELCAMSIFLSIFSMPWLHHWFALRGRWLSRAWPFTTSTGTSVSGRAALRGLFPFTLSFVPCGDQYFGTGTVEEWGMCWRAPVESMSDGQS
eukprot:3050979-Pyramimonas_sp.AAC.1